MNIIFRKGKFSWETSSMNADFCEGRFDNDNSNCTLIQTFQESSRAEVNNTQ